MSLENDVKFLKELLEAGNPVFKARPEPEPEDYEDKVKRISQESVDYFARCKICPTGNDIIMYVADQIEDESGHMDEDGIQYIARILGMNLDEAEQVFKPATEDQLAQRKEQYPQTSHWVGGREYGPRSNRGFAQNWVNGINVLGLHPAHMSSRGDVLYSYNTPIAVKNNGLVYLLNRRFSSTTSKQQYYVRAAAGDRLREVDPEEFKALALEAGVNSFGWLREAEMVEDEQPIFRPASEQDLKAREDAEQKRKQQEWDRQSEIRRKAEEVQKAKVRAVVQKIIKALKILGAVRIVNNPYQWSSDGLVHGVLSGGETIAMSTSGDRIEISGTNYPTARGSNYTGHVYDEDRNTMSTPSISVSAAKTPEQIARDVERRFVAHHKHYHARAKHYADESNEYEDKTLNALTAIKGKPLDDYEKSRKSVSLFRDVEGVYGHAKASGDSVSLEVSGLSADQVKKIALILNSGRTGSRA